jgi:diacylglycerol kinase family enzyme
MMGKKLLVIFNSTAGKAHSMCLAVIPAGRGNDFSFGAGVPKSITENLKTIAIENSLPMDMGLITGWDYP